MHSDTKVIVARGVPGERLLQGASQGSGNHPDVAGGGGDGLLDRLGLAGAEGAARAAGRGVAAVQAAEPGAAPPRQHRRHCTTPHPPHGIAPHKQMALCPGHCPAAGPAPLESC